MRWSYAAAALGCLAAAGFGIHAWFYQGQPERPVIPNASIQDLLAHADAGHGARLFWRCAACHNIGKDAPDRNGPNLYGVLGGPVAGSSPRFGYTRALRSVGGRWDAARMDAWLRNPQEFAPGNRMTFPGIPGSWDRADLIAYLAAQGPGAVDGGPAAQTRAAISHDYSRGIGPVGGE